METVIETNRQQKIKNRIAEIPKRYRGIYKKAVETNNKAAAIEASCLECVQWQRDEVANCSCPVCPLYGIRPFKK